MTPFFQDQVDIDWLRFMAGTWVGTPFQAHAAIKRVGVDCIHLCQGLYRDCGKLVDVEFPAYRMNEGRTAPRSKIIDWLEAHPDQFTQVQDAAPGDLICMRADHSVHHAGIVLSDREFIHAILREGVIISNRGDDTFTNQIQAVYRPLA